ncbi:MAG: universal stress protein [Paracoccaceae bacterium]|nr:universal stress protein [Paracoccaceae bacterium]
MAESVLAPIDLAHLDHARKILQVARKVGGAESRITALYITPEIPQYVAAELPEGILAKTDSTSRDTLEALAAETGAEAVVRKGSVTAEILECAREFDADLIVIGSHRPGLTDYLLGSTAARVVRHADCPVYVDR